MRVCRGKSLFAARKGKQPMLKGLRLISAHTDSPRLDLKQHPLLEQAGVGQAKTHYYGGIRKYQWLARPLALHGVVVREDGKIINVVIGDQPGDPVFTITDLLPHLAQKHVTQTVNDAFEAEKLNIIFGHSPIASNKKDEPKEPIKANILALLNKKYHIIEEDLYSAELQIVPAGPARLVGLDTSMIGGYGQDDRICVHTSLEAFLKAKPTQASCLVYWDKEEIGSEGSTGAQSRFFEYCARDLIDTWARGSAFGDIMTKSRAISADVHGALDPDWQDVHEKLNAAQLGHGPCMCKFTGSRGKAGANDAHPEYIGWLRSVFNSRGIPWQMAELVKVDLGGGGTVALYLAAYGMDVIDMGPSLLGMHSPFELSSKADLYATALAYQAFFEA
jgi:aspartyl aminopeptidase